MSYAKCFEDNAEIIEERKFMKEEGILSQNEKIIQKATLESKNLGVKKITPKMKKVKVITCVTCGETFKFNDGEQRFYKKHGFHEPTHCPECRARKKLTYKIKEVL